MDSIKCPQCGSLIEISQALKSQIEEQVLTAEKAKHQIELTRIREETEKKVKREQEEKIGLEMTDLRKALEEKEKKVSEFREQEMKLREEKRKIEEEKKELDLMVQRKIDEERKKVEELVLKQESEKHRLKEAEFEEKIKSMQRALEEAQRKAAQGSQQTQGEVLELDLEATLRNAFPQDLIEPVGKGVRGADIRQTIKSQSGVVCGVVLWESKRTKAWTDEWLSKLKDDLRAEGANIPVIVSETLPKESQNGMGVKEGVWVVSFALVLPLAFLLRKNLLEVAYQKFVSAEKGNKADQLYEYITGHEFRQQLEALVEVYLNMQEEITKERVAFEKIWKTREFEIKKLISSTVNVYSGVQGLIGQAMPQIKGLELLEEGVKS
ncbi:MAG: DUF2130 domain-containing protein [Patescibacteria group bacterium]|nr:DUF2130 domain-containing protein [Patescibacteria group bacterium]